ncbi:sigma-70 family RNA polymerase sigma factor [Streptomyces sp. APSN-46.1]|uniref:RNA polymerase sigma factor n=1 Tax=Streptomyces sp. APSN-46.1 TaxID=2929049 RepID=UPI001FB30F64|nr:sigma-70 family RNA polymerase sigma factor [Streptomyces sp. APSN-46.1]MCJ1676051.1 sigma-70 family RNA polymerase sigma factor [Streptomyces sp. APSN-46.1]
MSGSRHTPAGPRQGAAAAAVPPSDRDLTRQLRRSFAFGAVDQTVCDVLYRRHRGAVLAAARACCRAPQDAEDLVSETFIRTFQAVRSGAGPRDDWRPYLLAVVRHTAGEWRAGDGRTVLTPDVEAWCRPGPAGGDPQSQLLDSEDRRLVARSFHTLPERWKAVLWHTLVEDDCPHHVPLLLGITPSAVTSLAFRAREGLREAYLSAHLDAAADDRCRHYGAVLGAAIRRRGAPGGRGLARHLAACRPCARAYAELLDLNAALRAGSRAVLVER